MLQAYPKKEPEQTPIATLHHAMTLMWCVELYYVITQAGQSIITSHKQRPRHVNWTKQIKQQKACSVAARSAISAA
jgi:hypothetical protein